MKYDEFGREVLDDTPIEAPVKFRRPPSIQELIAMHVRAQTQVERSMRDGEDEDDFDEESEMDDILTPYELQAYAGEADLEMRKAEASKAVLDKLRGGKGEKGTGGAVKGAEEKREGAGGVDEAGGKGETGKESKGFGYDRGAAKGIDG